MVGESRRLNLCIWAIAGCVVARWGTVVPDVDVDCQILEGCCVLDGLQVMQLDGFFWLSIGEGTRFEEGGCLSCPSSSTAMTPIAANAFTNVINDASLLFSTATATAAEATEEVSGLVLDCSDSKVVMNLS